MNESLRAAFDEAVRLVEWLRDDAEALTTVDTMAEEIATCLNAGGRVITCGNGGSMCDSMHMAEELSGRYRENRRGLDAIALSDPGYLTCVANDFGYDQVFARSVEAYGKEGDVLVCMSTSGNSQNAILAVEQAKRMGIHTVGLLGKGGGKMLDLVDLAIVVPHADTSDRIQEIHIKVVHALIEGVERRLYPDNYR